MDRIPQEHDGQAYSPLPFFAKAPKARNYVSSADSAIEVRVGADASFRHSCGAHGFRLRHRLAADRRGASGDALDEDPRRGQRRPVGAPAPPVHHAPGTPVAVSRRALLRLAWNGLAAASRSSSPPYVDRAVRPIGMPPAGWSGRAFSTQFDRRLLEGPAARCCAPAGALPRRRGCPGQAPASSRHRLALEVIVRTGVTDIASRFIARPRPACSARTRPTKARALYPPPPAPSCQVRPGRNMEADDAQNRNPAPQPSPLHVLVTAVRPPRPVASRQGPSASTPPPPAR